MRKLSAVIGMIAIAIYASADVRNIRPPITGEGKLGTTTYKWGEVNAVDGYYSNLILGGQNITDKFLSPYDGEAGEVFYANGLGGGVWGAASSPTNGISQSVAESLFATVAQGAKADASLPKDGSSPMTGDLDMDGYDIDDAGVVNAERFKTTRNNLNVEILTLIPKADSKVGYEGVYDYVGAAGGVGFYAVSSSGTNSFELGYLSTNNYINIQSSVISATSNILEKVTGYGTCTTNDYPVVGLVAGDNYVTFAQTNDLTRTNAVDYSRFGSVVATFTPSQPNISAINLHITLMYNTSGGIQRNDIVNVYANWRTDLTTPYFFSDVSMLNSDYGTSWYPKFMSKGNQLILFNGYRPSSLDIHSIRANRSNISAVCTATFITTTTN